MAPHARDGKPRTPSTAGFAQPAGCAGAEQCSANSLLRPWDGPVET